MESDEQLLVLALQGDGASFGRLCERWKGRIFGFILRYVGNSEEAKDLTQDTFVKAYQNLHRLADPARFSSWLYTIALNECRMRFRRERGQHSLPLEEFLEGQQIEDGADTPEEVLGRQEKAVHLKAAFSQLPEEQRLVILMKEYQGLKFHQIAEILDIPLSTVKSRMYLGLKTLRKIMEKRL